MKEAIVIGTSVEREDWIYDIVKSISVPYILVSTGNYELGKIKWVYDNTDIDRFIFLQDSLVIRDNFMFEKIFEAEGSCCIMCDPTHMGSYLGLWERKTLEQTGIPIPNTKKESMVYEWEWTKEYVKKCEILSHPLEIEHQMLHTVMKNKRENLLYVNNFYEKWKGDWGQNG